MKEPYDNSKFYNAQERWLKDRTDKEAWNIMWAEVYNCCTSLLKKRNLGFGLIQNLEEKAMDSTVRFMSKYITGRHPDTFRCDYLATFCDKVIVEYLYGHNTPFEESAMQFPEEADYYGYGDEDTNNVEEIVVADINDIIDNGFEDRIIEDIMKNE